MNFHKREDQRQNLISLGGEISLVMEIWRNHHVGRDAKAIGMQK